MYKVYALTKSRVEIGIGSGLIFWARSKLYYTAAHRFGIVIMALDGVFMRFDVNDNFFENDAVCTMLFLKTEGGKYLFL